MERVRSRVGPLDRPSARKVPQNTEASGTFVEPNWSRRYLCDKSLRPGSIESVATQKISVTLETTAIERARKAAGPRGLSAYVDAALEDKLERDERRRSFLAFLDEIEAADPTSEQIKRRAQRRASKIRDTVSA